MKFSMNVQYSLFFELIQIAIGSHSHLKSTYSNQEWNNMFFLAEKQSIIGICFAAIEKLPKEQNLDIDLLMEWLGQTEYVKTTNEQVNKQCVEVQKRLKDFGLDSCILKGQGVGSLYGKLSLYRNSGDIDIWVNSSYKDVMGYVNSISPNREFDGKHTHLNIFDDTTVEVHWWPSTTSNFFLDRKLKKFYREQATIQCKHKVTLVSGETITATDPFFDSIHVLLHIYGHFLYEGVGLRQMMDYYFVLLHEDVQNRREEIIQYYKDFGIYKFSQSVMWVMQKVFGMDDKFLLSTPDEKGGQELLDEIMEGGNFGHASAENQVRNESTAHRWMRRVKRKVRLIKYNPVGLLCNPLYKIGLLVWKYKIIKKYNL